MLRYVRVRSNSLQQIVDEFCCSRVIFSRVNIHLPDIKLLFDRDFIFKTFKQYKRDLKSEPEPFIIRALCGKCDGYGFYDWVSRLTTDENCEDPLWTRGDSTPLILKNENLISKLYLHSYNTHDTYYYVSEYSPNNMTYRCEQCLGTGIHLENISLKAITANDIPEQKPIPPEPKHSFITALIRHIRRLYNDKKFQNKENRQEV